MDVEVQNVINALNEKADMAAPAQQENNIEFISAANREASVLSNCTDEFPLCNKVRNITTITTTSTSLNELKNFRISRKREVEGSIKQQVDEKPLMSIPTLPLIVPPPPPLLQPPPAKQFRFDNQIAERKSIIEIHIANVEVKKLPSNEIDNFTDSKLDDNEIIENSKQLLENIKEEIKTEECANGSESNNDGDGNALENGTAVKVPINEEDKHLEDSKTQDIVEICKDNVEAPKTPVEVVVDEPKIIEDQQKLQEKLKEEAEHLSSLEKLTPEEAMKDQEYRKECKVFLQHLPCFKLESNDDNTASLLPNTIIPVKIPKCRECRRRTPQQGSNDVYCRFYEFRCFQYTNEGHLLIAGFPNPYMDATQEDLNIWQPDENTEPTSGYMDIQVCRYILLHVGDQFCHLWRQEVEALKLHENPNSTIAWKKVVQGIREICDVCDTTLFNYHWTCDKCGFGVCLDCFKDCKGQVPRRKTFASHKPKKGCDEYGWLLCTFGSSHNIKELILTQIIAGDALNVLGRLLHGIRVLWEIPQLCGCLLSKQKLPDGDLKNFIQDMIKESQLKQQTTASSLATEETKRKQERLDKIHAKTLEFARSRGIDYVPGRIWNKQTLGKDPITTAFDNCKHINFLRKGLTGYRRFLPPRAMTLTHSTLLAPGVPHEWHDGKLLRLMNPSHPDNRILFQEVWKCGQPVMISEVAKSLNLDLWRPEAFLRDFGDKPNDLINCLNGNLVPNQPMRHFWEGFQCMNKRLLDANGKPMLLKLKDWPPGDDFAEILPTRYQDLMRGLPMPEYTLRTGNLNIASCLPKMFVPPDLGPKMYNAYGSAFHPDKGTTNLHLDISDAVNIMVYVGIPDDIDSKAQIAAAHKAIATGGCEFLMRARVLKKDVFPGALWHIFPARDADKIRDLLNRITLEKGYRLEPDHDPIHDQNWYLDDKLRARLFKEYGVEGYPIVQCLGDAVFIPAGAPHQVQNLHNCIKVAEDFVSPENITHCFHLTQEFRLLSHSHTNHEDKLQIKNIVYHAIKDCCTILKRALEKRICEETELIEAKLEKSRLLKLNATAREQQSGSSAQVSGIPSDKVDASAKSTENSTSPSAESETIFKSSAKPSTSVDKASEELSINNRLPTVSGDQLATSDENVFEIPKSEKEKFTIINTDTERKLDSKIAVVLSYRDNDESILINKIPEAISINTEDTNDTNLSANEKSISRSEVSGGVLNCDIPNISSLSAKNESITELELRNDELSNDSNLSSKRNSTSVHKNPETESIEITLATAAK